MSYDLMFEAGPEKKLDKKTFAAHFRSRRNYKVENGQAIYQNEDTGVYFIFDEPEDGVVAFNLNYFRPHVFGLEAAAELEQFAAAFATRVGDPQGEMEEEFSTEGFLRGWNAGNQFGYRSMLSQQSEPVRTWPQQRIQEVWEWNYGRAAQQEREGEGIFLPAIWAIELDGAAFSMAIWPPGCPILLPTVDGLLVPVSQNEQESQETAFVRWEEILPVVSAYQEPAPGLPRYRLAFEQWPDPIATFLAQPRQPVGELSGIGLDQILDQELVEAASRA